MVEPKLPAKIAARDRPVVALPADSRNTLSRWSFLNLQRLPAANHTVRACRSRQQGTVVISFLTWLAFLRSPLAPPRGARSAPGRAKHSHNPSRFGGRTSRC